MTAVHASVRTAVFIDPRVRDPALLAAGVEPGTACILLHPDRDGPRQVADGLAARGLSDLAAIHLVSHGEPGRVQLGATWLDADALAGHAEALARIGAALAPGGSLCLYGCETAAGGSGRRFLDRVSRALGGAAVTASTRIVGAQDGGGTWSLDAQAGPVRGPAAPPFTAAARAAYAGTFQYLRSDSRANDTTTDSQNEPRTLALSGGGYVVAWLDYSDFGRTNRDIVIRFYGADGTASSNEIRIKDGAPFDGPDYRDIALAALPGGNFVVVYADQNYGPPPEGPPANAPDFGNGNFNVWAEIYNASGVRQGSRIQVPATLDKLEYEPSVTSFSDGRFVVTWTQSPTTRDPATDEVDVYGQLFEADGTKLGGNYRVADSVQLEFNPSTVALLDGSGGTTGRYVTVWQSEDADSGRNLGLFLKIYEIVDDEATAGSTITVDAGGFAGNATALAGGGFVITYTVDGDITDVAYRVYNAAGGLVASGTSATDKTGEEANAQAVALADGGFIIHWDDTPIGGDVDVRAQRYTADGTALGLEFQANQRDIRDDDIGSGGGAAASLRYVPNTTGQVVSLSYESDETNTNTTDPDIYNTVYQVHSAPSGTSRSGQEVRQGQSYTFAVADFGFGDSAFDATSARPQGDAFTAVVITTLPTTGTLRLNGTAITTPGTVVSTDDIAADRLTYQAANTSGTPSFTFQVRDSGGTDTGSVNTDASADSYAFFVPVNNTPPVANDDAVSATEAGGSGNATFGVNPTGNLVRGTGAAGAVADTDEQDASSALTVVAVRTGAEGGSGTAGTVGQALSGAHGVLTLNSEGFYTYSVSQADPQVQALAPGQSLTDTFTYMIRDTGGLTDTATLTVTINGADDTATLSAPSNASFTEDGPAVSPFSGVTLSDPDTPRFQRATATIPDGIAGDVLEAGTVTPFTAQYDATTYTLTLTGPGTRAEIEAALRTITYRSTSDNPTQNGTDDTRTVQLQVVGEDGIASNTVTASVAVTGVNDAPTATNLSAPETYTEDTALDLTDIVVTDDSASVTATLTLSDPAVGTLTTSNGATFSDGRWTVSGSVADVNAALAAVSFTPAADVNRDFTLTTSISDGEAAPITGSKSFTGVPVADAPTAGADAAATSEDVPVERTTRAAGLLANDTDPDDGDAAALVVASARAGADPGADTPVAADGTTAIVGVYGTLVLAADGTYSYTPDSAAAQALAANQPATEVFTYTVRDPGGLTSDAQLTISLTGANDAPVIDLNGASAGIDNAAGYTERSPPVTLAADLSVSDVDDGAVIRSAQVQITGGLIAATDQLSVGGATGGNVGSIAFTYTASTGTLSLTGDGTPEEYRAVLAQVGFSSTSGNPGTGRTIGWTVNDGSVDSTIATTTLAVTSTNEAPTANPDVRSVAEDATIAATTRSAGLLANDTDPDDGDAAALVVASARAGTGTDVTVAGTGTTAIAGTYGTLALAADGTYRFTADSAAAQALAAGERASETFTYTVRDPGGLTSSATLTIAITGVNDAPVLSGDGTVAVLQGGSVVVTTADLTARDVDGPEDGLSYTVTATSRGQVLVGGAAVSSFTQAQLEDGAVGFRQDGSGEAAASFTVTASDGTASSAPKTITAAVDLIPTITGIAYGANDGTLRAGERVELIVRLSESVTVTGTPTLALSSGGTASFVSGSGSDTLVFAYTVAAGQNTADLAVTGLSLDSGTIRDGGGQTTALPAGGVNPAGVLAVDTGVPGAPTIALVNDTGASASDRLTFDPTFAVVPAEAGGTLLYQVDGTGAFSADRPVFATDGSDDGLRSVTVVQEDAAGNRGPAASLSFTLDTIAPSVEIEGVTGATNVVGHTLVGGAEAGGVVTITNGGTAFGTATAGANGAFDLPFVFEGDGPRADYAFTASQTDLAGNVGSDAFAFSLDFTPNRALFGEVVSDPGSVEGQVYALFDGLLGRAPDASGWGSFTAALDGGASLQDLAQAVLTSAEFTARFGNVAQASDEAFVDALYQIALGRGPDAQGEQTWLAALAGGTSRAQVALGFAFSNENQGQIAPAFQAGVYVPDPIETDVARLYYGLLDRAPDAGGQQNWSGNAEAGLSLEAVAQGFLTSAEYGALHPGGLSDEAYVASLYEGALGRAPDAAGEQGWLDALAAGATRAQVAVGIADSAEANAHLLGRIEAGWHLS